MKFEMIACTTSRSQRAMSLTLLWAHYCAAIAVLWIDFVREVRWCWDEGFRLPRVSVDGSPDLESCILHQKLQMVITKIPYGAHAFVHILLVGSKQF